jgi:hypothetical protein
MGRSRRKDEKEGDGNEIALKELKAKNRRLKSDNDRLKAEIATLHEAFGKTAVYLKGNTDGMSVEKVIEGVKKGATLAQIKKVEPCDKCKSDKVKEIRVPSVGTVIMCTECQFRKVIKNGKED